MKKMICCLCIAILLLPLCFENRAFAKESRVVPLSYQAEISEEVRRPEKLKIRLSLYFSGGTAFAGCRVTGAPDKVKKVSIRLYLQIYKNGKWKNRDIWSATKKGYSAALNQSRRVARGRYRICASVTWYTRFSKENKRINGSSRWY